MYNYFYLSRELDWPFWEIMPIAQNFSSIARIFWGSWGVPLVWVQSKFLICVFFGTTGLETGQINNAESLKHYVKIYF